MNLKYRISSLVVGLVSIVLITAFIGRVVYVGENNFFIMAVLGKDNMLRDYYPNGDSNIEVGFLVLWNIVVHSNMGDSQYVAIRVKALNSTTPGSGVLSPSPVPALLELRYSLTGNETISLPFHWSILKINNQGSSVVINQFVINEVLYTVNVSAMYGFNFRFVFELWYYNTASQNFEFAWRSGGVQHCIWNQLWFNATAS